MTIGSIFTLFVLPSIYVLLAKDHSRDRVREAAGVPVLDEAETVPVK